MFVQFFLFGISVSFRLGGNVFREDSRKAFLVLSTITSVLAIWFAILIFNVWIPFWPILPIGFLYTFYQKKVQSNLMLLLSEIVLILILLLFAIPRPGIPLYFIIAILIPGGMFIIDFGLSKINKYLSRKWIIAFSLLGWVVLAFIPSFRDAGRRVISQQILPMMVELPVMINMQNALPDQNINGELSFTDITKIAGTEGPIAPDETGGHGVMWADVNGNGFSDLYVTMNWKKPMADLFFVNLGNGRFTEDGLISGIDDFDGGSHGACWGDLDNDGDFDLHNGTTTRTAQALAVNDRFRNDGNGFFENMTSGLSEQTLSEWPTRAVLCFDMDNDGDLDLFGVTNYQGSNDPPSELNELYRNDGDWNFTLINTGELVTAPAGQGATDTDYDGDGDIDVLIANRTGDINIIRNEGDGLFTMVVPEQLGITHRAEDGISSADIDNDGDLDLLLSGDGYGELYEQGIDGQFSHKQQFRNTSGYMGGFADLDNDGDLDLVFAGDDQVYLNAGGLQEGEIGNFISGPSIPVRGIDDPRAIAFTDVDNDGDLDFAIGAKRSRNWLVQNNFNQGNWLKIQLVAPNGQAGAFGAKLLVYAADGEARGDTLIAFREARSNSGYLAQDDPILHVGLGDIERVNVIVQFLDGSQIEKKDVSVGQTILIDASNFNYDQKSFPDLVGTQWAPYLEWHLLNPEYEGNPYDLLATATFVHQESGERRTTEMFYDGDNIWKFRFSGTLPGEWRFLTESDYQALDGYSGKVFIFSNPTSAGFVTNYGNKWGRTGNEQAFVPQYVMIGGPQTYYNNPKEIAQNIQIFFIEHGFNGMHTPVFCRWFDIDQQNCNRLNMADPNPDPRTFEALEALISEVYKAGGVVHIWMWGDDSRGENPKRWGLNGNADQRLQRYIAARLSPLPGWTMGYGYDLFEWVDGDDLDQWHDYMQQHLAWFHYLGARSSKNQLDQLSEVMDYASYEQHRPGYEQYVRTIDTYLDKPAISEDRFRIRDEGRSKDYTMDMTRRGLWHSAMAGGVANIWGNLIGTPQANDSLTTSAPYPAPEMIQTYAIFFENRFVHDLTRCNNLTSGVCLMRPTNTHFIFYAEDVTLIEMDLSAMSGAQTAVAVDTKLPYSEIEIGLVESADQTWTAPYASDWAIAVGTFENP